MDVKATLINKKALFQSETNISVAATICIGRRQSKVGPKSEITPSV